MSKLLLLGLVVFSFVALAADVSGTWNAAVETDAGAGTPTFVFKQTGDQLTGSYAGALGEAKITGSVKGDQVTWSFTVAPDGENIKVIYTGTLEGDSKMKGAIDFGSLGKGTFTATKK
jgi:hypothetical protein